MSMRDEYRKKIEAELDLTQAKVGELKAKFHDMSMAGEDAWETLKDGLEHTWKGLESTVKSSLSKLRS